MVNKRISVLIFILGITLHMTCFAEDFMKLTAENFDINDKYQKENQITANFIQEVWPEDIDSLSATVTAEFYDFDKNVNCSLALYDEEGRLVSVASETKPSPKGGISSFNLSAGKAKLADSAKLMVWDSASQKPLREAKTIEKIKNALIIYLDPEKGSDTNDGTFQSPIKTLKKAVYSLRTNQDKLGPNDDTIYFILKNGEYFMNDVFKLEPKDLLSNRYQVVFTALETQKAVLTGAVDITGFTLWDENKDIYRAEVGTDINSRQLFADGIRCVRARRDEPPAGYEYKDGVATAQESEFLDFKHIEDLEFAFENNWMHDRCMVTSVKDLGGGTIQFNMSDEVWKQLTTKNYFSSAKPTYMENAYEFIDEGGEWYLDTHEGYLYYKPRAFEDMKKTRFTMPVKEDFMKLSSVSSPIKNIDFRGLEFTQSTWMFPSINGGLCINQNEYYRTGSNNVPMEGVIELKNTENVNFYNCKFSKLGRTALKMINGARNCTISGNEFCDLSAGALSVGGVTDLERNPDNVSLSVKNVKVENNFIHDIAEDIKSCAAVSAGFPIDTRIGNNEIYNTGYSGIHTGWGWGTLTPSATKNFIISNNYIHKILNDEIYDGGAVYMLGHTGGSVDNLNKLTENYVEDIRKPFGALYPDEGSSYWEISNNVVDLSKQPIWYYGGGSARSRWTHIHKPSINHIYYNNNYSTTGNMQNSGTSISYQPPKIYAQANWPDEALQIIDRSGIQPQFEDCFSERLEEFYDSGNISTYVGGEIRLNVTPTTSKAKFYNSAKFDSYAQIKNDGILAFRNGKIYAMEKGETEVTITAVENNLIREHTVKVIVN